MDSKRGAAGARARCAPLGSEAYKLPTEVRNRDAARSASVMDTNTKTFGSAARRKRVAKLLVLRYATIHYIQCILVWQRHEKRVP